MLKYNFSTILMSISLGAIYSFSTAILAQDPIEIPLPVGNDSEIEAVDAEDSDYETLTRGPLHEAFAEPIVSDPAPGLVVSQEPPPPIDELPPEYRPDGEDAVWISGYWGWDEEREDFIWISGVYRIPPQGHQWMPGYWHPVSGGWQWVQGFWVEDISESIVYMPPPPATLENGPSSPSPGVDFFYIPGNWTQSTSVSSGYVWNAGYWHPMQNDFVWIPAHVVWTPRGCVFVNGYWDQRLPMRGFCFAPVLIPRATYIRPGWHYRPNVVLNSQVVLHNLFVQPRYNHYLFGDYYGLPSTNRSVLPAYVYHQRRGSCDPLISFYSAYNARQGQDLMRWYGNQYADLSRNPSHRPPQTWSSQKPHSDSLGAPGKDHSSMAHRLDQVNALAIGPRIAPIPAGDKSEFAKRDLDLKRLAKVREESERNSMNSDAGNKNNIASQTLSLPKFEHNLRKLDSTLKIGNIPELPRNSSRDRENAETNKQQDRLPRDNKLGQDTRRIDPIPRNIEPKRNDPFPRLDVNPLPKATTNNRSFERPGPLDSTLPRNQSIPPNVISPPPLGERKRENTQQRLPNTDARIPNIELNRSNLLPRNLNTEPRIQNNPLPQSNRQPNSNENPKRSNRGSGDKGEGGRKPN